ncbi:MAG: hypothetical protein B6D59_00465 [Campylobacteraceae bacterium 4484_4]|nr:MAG: hypothetical protein B6D59_00465 [Campylobacteraceae bacterium 4484_4]
MGDTLLFALLLTLSLFGSYPFDYGAKEFADRSDQKQECGDNKKKDNHKIVLFSFAASHRYLAFVILGLSGFNGKMEN